MRPVVKGSTDQSVVIRIVDSGDGTPETGVTSATSGLDLKYRREGAATVNLAESDLSALTDAHTDGGMLHIGAGYYRVDPPDAAFASGANGVLVFGTVTGMVVIACYVPLVDFNPYDGVRGGLTALPNAAAEAAGGLYTRGTGAGQIAQDSNGTARVRLADEAHGGTAAVLTLERLRAVSTTSGEPGIYAEGNGTGAGLHAEGGTSDGTPGFLARTTAIDGAAGFRASGAVGILCDSFSSTGVFEVVGAVTFSSAVTATHASNDIRGIRVRSDGLAAVTSWTVAITGNITGNLSGSVGSVTGAVGSVTGAVGSVTGNVGGNVAGTVGSVVTKTGYALASTGLDLVLVDGTALPTVMGRVYTVTCGANDGADPTVAFTNVYVSAGGNYTATATMDEDFNRIEIVWS